MFVKNVQITILVEDSENPSEPHLKSKHGLSLLINAEIGKETVTILMDTGPSPDVLFDNADVLGVNLEDVDVIVLSHGHYDHTGGLLQALKCTKKRVPVIGHPQVLEPKFSLKPHLRSIGAHLNRFDVESAGGVPVFSLDPVKIADGITTTGQVPRTTPFEEVDGFWTVQNNRFVEDSVLDDQSLVINSAGKGLIIVAGCAHAGIINTVKYAQSLTGEKRVYAVLGGFHLVSADNTRIHLTVNELKKLNSRFVGPCHCTGKKAVKEIAEAFGNRCHTLCTGDVIKL